jgi:hypothetical protein
VGAMISPGLRRTVHRITMGAQTLGSHHFEEITR